MTRREYPHEEFLVGAETPKAQDVRARVEETAKARLAHPERAADTSAPPSTHPATWILKRVLNVIKGRTGKPKTF